MPIARTKTFRSGNSEAVRLPRDLAYGEGVELMVIRSGDVTTIYPVTSSIPAMIERLQALPRPPVIEERDVEELPERRGL
jgi:antitoxin VapB